MTVKKWFLELRSNFDSRVNLKRASINSTWLLSEQIIRLIVGFFISIVTTRYLGPTGLGLLSYSGSWIGMFSAFAFLGLDSIVIKKLIEKKENIGTILGSALVLKFFGSLLTVLLSVSLLFVFGQHDFQTIFLVLIISLGYIFLPSGIVDFYYQSMLKARYTVLIRTTTYLVVTILKFVCIVFKANIYFFGLLMALEMVINALGYGILFYKKEKIKLTFDWREVKSLLFLAFPLFLSAFLVGIYSKIDQIFVGSLINKESLGYYSLSVSLIQMFYFIPTIVISSVFPILVEEKSKSNFNSYKKKIWKTLKYLAFAAVFLIICANFTSRILIKLLYGDQFLLSAKLLNIYSLNLLPVFTYSIFSYWLLIEGKQKLILYFQVIALFADIFLSYVLIKNYGVYGACFTTLIVNIILLCLYCIFYRLSNNYEQQQNT